MSKYSPYSPSLSNPRATSSTLCQKCLQRGHFTYQCKKSRPYVSRPSRTQLLDNPKLREKEKEKRTQLLSEGLPEEFRKRDGVADALLTAKEVARASGPSTTKAKKRTSSSSSPSDESGSDSESTSSHSSQSDSDSSSESNASQRNARRRQRSESQEESNRVPYKRRRSES